MLAVLGYILLCRNLLGLIIKYIDQSIGLKIRKVRELKDFSQGFVADKLSVSQSTYSDIENGKQTISKEKLEKIADVLGVTPEMIENFSEHVVFKLL